MPERITGICKSCYESLIAFIPLLFAKQADMSKNINKVRIVEMVVGSLICSLVIGGFMQYTAVVILKEKTSFFEQRIGEAIIKMEKNQEEFDDLEREVRGYKVDTDKRFEEIYDYMKEEKWLRRRVQ